jgi:Tfp pilus assembly protein PilN
MQDINLLQNKLKDNTARWQKNQRMSVVVLSLILLAELAAAGFFYMLTKSAEESMMALNQENTTIQTRMDQLDDQLVAARGFQAQTKNLTTLVNNHVIWTNLIDELASSTFKSAQYMGMNSTTTGVMHIEGITNNYSDLGKMLLALETSDKFTSVKLISTSPSTDETAGIMFSVDVVANQEIFINKE